MYGVVQILLPFYRLSKAFMQMYFLVLVSYLYGLFYMNLYCFAANQIQVYYLRATYKAAVRALICSFQHIRSQEAPTI